MMPRHPGKTIVFLTLGLVLLLFLLSKNSLADLGANIFLTAAQVAALLGTALFALSFMIASRSYLVEEAFGGLDHAYRVHHKTGVWSFSLLVVHLAAVIIGYGLSGTQLFVQLTTNPVFISGEAAVTIMAAIILTIIFAKIKYQSFVFVQKFFALPYAIGVYHLLIVPSDVARYAPLRLSMLAIVTIGALAWIYREFFYKRYAPQAAYTVKQIDRKGADIFEFTLSPIGKPLAFSAGQFAYFSFRSGRLSSEPHPFSFTSAPGSNELTFAAKALGDFTRTLGEARVGDQVVVYGPYGKFFEGFNPDKQNVFVAGGIGITPFLSVLRGSHDHDKTSIFYTTRNSEDCVYNPELDRLSKNGVAAFKYHFHGSDQRGYLTADIVDKRAGGLSGKTIYLCGPAPMMKKLSEGFLAKGVPRHKIIFERFSYS